MTLGRELFKNVSMSLDKKEIVDKINANVANLKYIIVDVYHKYC